MVSVNSTMLPLGTAAPSSRSPTPPDGSTTSTASPPSAPALVVMFLSNHCPYVKHIGRELGLVTQRELAARGVAVVGIMSQRRRRLPRRRPRPHGRRRAPGHGWDFPYLYDETQEVALGLPRRLHAGPLRVRRPSVAWPTAARSTASRPTNDVQVTGADLRAAVNAVLAGGTADRATSCRRWAATSSGGPATNLRLFRLTSFTGLRLGFAFVGQLFD